jgi:hypothetical protein
VLRRLRSTRGVLREEYQRVSCRGIKALTLLLRCAFAIWKSRGGMLRVFVWRTPARELCCACCWARAFLKLVGVPGRRTSVRLAGVFDLGGVQALFGSAATLTFCKL